MLKINPKIKKPGNETEEHFLLKNVAVSLLKHRFGCQYVGSELEIGTYYNEQLRKEYPDFKWIKKVADAVGIQRRKIKGGYQYVVRNIEVKISKRDIDNGYCTSGDYNYVMIPKGLKVKNLILPFMGIIEVDLEKLEWKNGFVPIDGVEIVSNPRRVNIHRNNKNIWVEKLKDMMLRNYVNAESFRGTWFYPGFKYKK